MKESCINQVNTCEECSWKENKAMALVLVDGSHLGSLMRFQLSSSTRSILRAVKATVAVK